MDPNGVEQIVTAITALEETITDGVGVLCITIFFCAVLFRK